MVGAITPVELPAAPGRREGRRRARRRLHGRAQAGRGHAADRVPARATSFARRPGCPAGVLNVVSGTGPVAGQALVEHPGVDMVSFTGSTAVGRRIGAIAGGALKRVALELGGKSANVILPGADLGQGGEGRRRQRVPQLRPDLQRVDADAGARVDRTTRRSRWPRRPPRSTRPVTRSTPARGSARSSPTGSATRVRGYIEQRRRRGRPPGDRRRRRTRGTRRGYFVRPTVFADVTPDMTHRAGGDLRAGAVDPALPRRGRGARDRQRHRRTGWPAASGRPTPTRRSAFAAPDAHRPGRHQRRRVQPARSVRRLQASGLGRELGRHGLAEFLQTKSHQF